MFFDAIAFDVLDGYRLPSFAATSTLARSARCRFALTSFQDVAREQRTFGYQFPEHHMGDLRIRILDDGPYHQIERFDSLRLKFVHYNNLLSGKFRKLMQSSPRIFNPSTRGIMANPKPATLSICKNSSNSSSKQFPCSTLDSSPRRVVRVYNRPRAYLASTPSPDSSSCSSQSYPRYPPPSSPVPEPSPLART